MSSFEKEHEQWIAWHLKHREGERKDALRRGLGYGNKLFAESIWWTLMGHFNNLHPEYEVKDWRGRSYFLDFVWISGSLRIAFEIMDYGSHGKDRTKYRLDLNRQLFLQSQQYLVFSISLDEMKENPQFVLSMLRAVLATFLTAPDTKRSEAQAFGKIERQLIRYAIRKNRIVRPGHAASELELHRHTIIKYCRELVRKGKLRAVHSGTSNRVDRYEYLGAIQSLDWL